MNKCPKCDNQEIDIDKSYEFFNVFTCKQCEYWTYNLTDDCCRNPITKYKLRLTDKGQRFIYKQCENCGGRIKSPPLSFKKFGDRITGNYETELLDLRYEKLKKENDYLKRKKHLYNITDSRFAIYRDYLGSDEWKAKRILALERDNYLCQKCKINDASEVHHLTYKNLGNENLDELLSVCEKCHIEIHRFS